MGGVITILTLVGVVVAVLLFGIFRVLWETWNVTKTVPVDELSVKYMITEEDVKILHYLADQHLEKLISLTNYGVSLNLIRMMVANPHSHRSAEHYRSFQSKGWL